VREDVLWAGGNRSLPEASGSRTRQEQTLARARWVVCILAALLILAAARGDLYNDELWSLRFAQLADSPADFVRRFQHDNNHVLNTFYLFLVRGQRHLYVFRLLSVVTGSASVALAGHLAARK